MICEICHAPARGFGFLPRLANMTGSALLACSMGHMKMIKESRGSDISICGPTESQIAEAVKAAGFKGGTFLDGIGQSDLRYLASDQFQKFIQEVLDGYHETLKGFANERG